VVFAFAHVLAAGLAVAEPLRCLGDAPISVIRRTLEPLLPLAVEQMDRYDAERAVVYEQQSYNTAWSAHITYSDQIWWIRSGEAPDLTNFVRDFDPGVTIKTVKAFRIRAGSCDPQAALKAPIEMITPDRIRITPGDMREKRANLVIAFDSAEPGDLIGIGIETYRPWGLFWNTWHAATDYPVVRAESRVRCEPGDAYALFGSRFRKDQFSQEVLDEQKGQKLDFRVRLDGLPPYRNEPFSPPYYEQSPQITVSWRAWQAQRRGMSPVWIKSQLWNQVAADMANGEAVFLKKAKDAAKKADKLAGKLPPREAADTLFRYVRDELMDIRSGAFKKPADQTTVDDILKTGSGGTSEKAYVLLAMLEAVGVDAELVWAHDPAEGDYFADFPDWSQVGTPLLHAAVDGADLWYDLGCATCPPGSVRERMWGSQAFGYDRSAGVQREAIRERAYKDAYNQQVEPFGLYLERIAPLPWARSLQVPGQSTRLAGWCEERIGYLADTADDVTARCEIRSCGPTPVRARTAGEEPVAAVGGWIVERYKGFEKADGRLLAAGATDTLALAFDLSGDPLAAPMGDTWILPPETVFGTPSVGAWPSTRVTPCKVPYDVKKVWEFRAPLPTGWADAETPQGQAVDSARFTYRLSFAVEGGALLVRREQLERAGVVDDPQGLEAIGSAVAVIHELESTPVVVRRRGGE